jgi:hypothetical protein
MAADATLAAGAAVPAGRVDATGTQRRLQALVANGRPLAEIARHLGKKPGPVGRILTQATVSQETELAVYNLYRALGDKIPEPVTAAERQQFNAAREFAARQGWPPAMAWELDQMDDPDGQPEGGWDGWSRRPARGPARWLAVAEDAEFIRSTEGLGNAAIAERLEMTEAALERILIRAREYEQQAEHGTPAAIDAADAEAG